MKQVRQSAPALQGMIPYDPKYMKADVLISANESPLDVPPEVKDAVLARIGKLAFNRYPDPLANSLRRAIAKHWGVQVQNVLCGNGGDELLYDIMVAWGGPGRKMLNFPPTFSVYETNAELRRALNMMFDGTLTPENPKMFEGLYRALVFSDNGGMADPYLVLKDFGSYQQAQSHLGADYLDQKKWTRKEIINVAKSGVFSSDRTIREYNDLIWHLTPLTKKR